MILLILLLVCALVFAILAAVNNSARYAAIAVIFLAALIAFKFGNLL